MKKIYYHVCVDKNKTPDGSGWFKCAGYIIDLILDDGLLWVDLKKDDIIALVKEK